MAGNYVDIPLTVFGGLFEGMPATALPAGASSDCANVKLIPGAVGTRPGINLVAGALGPSTANGVYLKTYICGKLGTLGLININMAVGSNAAFWESIGGGVWSQIPLTAPFSSTFKTSSSVTAFGREYFASGDGSNGTDMPLQFDGTFMDRVSQEGPGGAPTTGDSTIPGDITAGGHGLAVCFVTRQGYITAPGLISDWTAAGGFQAAVAAIPTGPSNVVARIIIMTLAGGGDFYYVPSMIINDNTTTTLNFSVPDTTLAAGTDATSLFDQIVLGECQGVTYYSSRLFWWGERNKINNALNLMFDGGFDPSTGVPLGWTPSGSPSPGGSPELVDVVWGGAWSLTGDGVSAFRGGINQQVATDQFGVPIIQLGTPYVVRARIKYDPSQPTPTAGTINVGLSTFPLPISGSSGITLNCASLTNQYVEYVSTPVTILPFGSHSTPFLHVYTGGILNNGARILVDVIEICPANQPFVDPSAARGSAAFNPESYDSTTSLIQVMEGSNIQFRNATTLRQNLYMLLDRGFSVTQDDGVNEPSGWSISEVSKRAGCVGVHALVNGDEWFVTVGYDGIYIFGGPEPQKISQELISLTNETQLFNWASINWNDGTMTWATLDTTNRRLLFGVPTSASTNGYANVILSLDFTAQSTWDAIANEPQVHDSAFTGKKLARDDVRKWNVWTPAAAIGCAYGANIRQNDGTYQIWLGNGSNPGNGEVYAFSDSTFSDFTVAINSYYATAYLPDPTQIEGIGARFPRQGNIYTHGFVTLNVIGSGTLNVEVIDMAGNIVKTFNITLTNPATQDFVQKLDVWAERLKYRLSTNAVGSWFILRALIPWVAVHPNTNFRS
jgi:hypothetical protein